MHVLNWRRLDSYCTSLTARGQKSSTFTANWILNWQYKQTLHRMCLIGNSIRIVNGLALLTMRCQVSNMRITVSGFMGHNIFLGALRLMLFSVFWEGANCWVNIRVKAKCECTKETIDYRLQYKRCDVIIKWCCPLYCQVISRILLNQTSYQIVGQMGCWFVNCWPS